MAKKVSGKEIAYEDVLFGVEFDDGWIYQAEDEHDAMEVADLTGGKLKVCEVYQTAWADLDE